MDHWKIEGQGGNTFEYCEWVVKSERVSGIDTFTLADPIRSIGNSSYDERKIGKWSIIRQAALC